MDVHGPKRDGHERRRYSLICTKVPSEYVCPLSWRIMGDPVLDPSDQEGRAIERAAFEEHQRKFGVRPLTGLPAIPSSCIRTLGNLQRAISHFLSDVEDPSQQQPLNKRPRLDSPEDAPFLMSAGVPQSGFTSPAPRPVLNLVECEVPAPFFCPLSRCVMSDPVVDHRDPGASMERAAVEAHVAQYGTNPLTGQPMAAGDLVPDKGLRSAINRWLAKHSGAHDEVRLHIGPVAVHDMGAPLGRGEDADTTAVAQAPTMVPVEKESAGLDQQVLQSVSTEMIVGVSHADVPSHNFAEAHRPAAGMDSSAGGTGANGNNNASTSGTGGNAGSSAGAVRADRGMESGSGAGGSSSGSSGTSHSGSEGHGKGGVTEGAGGGVVGAVENAATIEGDPSMKQQLQLGKMLEHSESSRSCGDRLQVNPVGWAGGGSSGQIGLRPAPTKGAHTSVAPAVVAAAALTANGGSDCNSGGAAVVPGRPNTEATGAPCFGPGLLLGQRQPTSRDSAAEAGAVLDLTVPVAAEAVATAGLPLGGGCLASVAAAQAAALWAAAAPPGITLAHPRVSGFSPRAVENGDIWSLSDKEKGAGLRQVPQSAPSVLGVQVMGVVPAGVPAGLMPFRASAASLLVGLQPAGGTHAEAGRQEGAQRGGRGRCRYSTEELEVLVAGLEEYGMNWEEIKAAKPELSKRSEISLCNKWRILLQRAKSGWQGSACGRVPPSLRQRIDRLLNLMKDPGDVEAADEVESEPEEAVDDDTEWHVHAGSSNVEATRDQQRYTDGELHALLDGILKHGYDWPRILGEYPKTFCGRTQLSLKQKWMSLRAWADRGWARKQQKGPWPPAEDVRVKVEAAMEREAVVEEKAGRASRYTEEEVEALVNGLSEFGLDFGAIQEKWPVLRSRSEMSLIFKWKWLRGWAARGWAPGEHFKEPPPEHVRRKVEALADAARTLDASVLQRQLIGMSTPIVVPDDTVLELLEERVPRAEVCVQVREGGFKTQPQVHAVTLRSNARRGCYQLTYCTALRKVLCGKEITGWEVTPKKMLLIMVRAPSTGGGLDSDDDGDGSGGGDEDDDGEEVEERVEEEDGGGARPAAGLDSSGAAVGRLGGHGDDDGKG